MNKDPYGQLASSLYASVGKHTRQALGGVGAVLGTITSTGLKLDDFKHEMQGYMVAELPGLLALPRYMAIGASGVRTDSPNWGSVAMATSFYFDETEVPDAALKLSAGLKPGDRVLAVRVNGGDDVVVVCRVVSGRG
ncbi:hypothetical protein FHS19_004414 [Paenibacillus rhizosphaerae]|uniref:Uncharacterized protein n=1 Tax=Paenibacillus rhizosphaerae TaxID=297318 RepID=A0A839TWU5_9BACL|nr:hypothetical protein [Paenibacillus rhizosphaerae]MBB3129739.1 hypothetical protein [Paenibacillus rhizosphaerae]